ncbi:6-bladed beta-propeller [Rhodothermus marinus]|uniref:6-bladed beta-propeller n=1 Tax=Rhodothermus marinus TaxID=29549 RepID=UPI0037CC3BE1
MSLIRFGLLISGGLFALILMGCKQEVDPIRSLLQGPYELGRLDKKDKIVLFDSVKSGERRVFLEQSSVANFMAPIMDYYVDDSFVYVLDGATPVKVFDREGNFVSTLGGYGEGPDEYLFPAQIFRCQDMVGIYDMVRKKFIFYKQLKYVYDFAFYAGGNLLDDPICHENYLYISVRGFTPDWPYHLLQIDTTGTVLKAVMPMNDKYYAYFLTGLFEGYLAKIGNKIALALALYKKVFYFDQNLDSLYSEPLIMPPRCETWDWPEINAIDIDNEREVNALRKLVREQAPCTFVSMFPFQKYVVYNYLIGENVNTKLPVSIIYDPKNRSRMYLIGGGRLYIHNDGWSECSSDMQYRLYCDFFQIDLRRATPLVTNK